MLKKAGVQPPLSMREQLAEIRQEVERAQPPIDPLHHPLQALGALADGVKQKYGEVVRNMQHLDSPNEPFNFKRLPTPREHPNHGAPEGLVEFAKKFDQYLPEALVKKGYTLSAAVTSKNDLETTPFHNAIGIGIAAAGANVIYDAFAFAISQEALPAILGVAAIGTVLAGAIEVGDVAVGKWHKTADHFSDRIMKFGFYSAEVHHDTPIYMAKYSAGRKAFQSWRALPALGAMALMNPTSLAMAAGETALATVLLWAVASFFIHGWVHSAQPELKNLKKELDKAPSLEDKAKVVKKYLGPGIKQALQKAGLALDRAYHMDHHLGRKLTDALPGEGDRGPPFLFNHSVAGGKVTGALSRFLEHGDWPLIEDAFVHRVTKALTGKGFEVFSAFHSFEAYQQVSAYRDSSSTEEARHSVHESRYRNARHRLEDKRLELEMLVAERGARGERPPAKEVKALEDAIHTYEVALAKAQKEWEIADPGLLAENRGIDGGMERYLDARHHLDDQREALEVLRAESTAKGESPDPARVQELEAAIKRAEASLNRARDGWTSADPTLLALGSLDLNMIEAAATRFASEGKISPSKLNELVELATDPSPESVAALQQRSSRE